MNLLLDYLAEMIRDYGFMYSYWDLVGQGYCEQSYLDEVSNELAASPLESLEENYNFFIEEYNILGDSDYEGKRFVMAILGYIITLKKIIERTSYAS